MLPSISYSVRVDGSASNTMDGFFFEIKDCVDFVCEGDSIWFSFVGSLLYMPNSKLAISEDELPV